MRSPVTDAEAQTTRAGGLGLFAAVFACVFVVPFFPPAWHAPIYNGLYTAIFLMAALSLEVRPKKLLALAVGVAGLEWVARAVDASLLIKASQVTNTAFFLFVVGGLILQIARTKNVDARVILASINGYLLLGLAASVGIALTVAASPGAIEFPSFDVSHRGSDSLYYGFVTLTTVGYGDVLPRTPEAKALASLIGVAGQLYVAIIIAMLVGKFSSKRD